MRTKTLGVLLMFFLSGFLGGCASRSATLNVTVLNYTDSSVFDLQIGKSFVQGHYRKKSGGGSVVGGVKVPVGKAIMKWEYDTFPEDTRPRSYFMREVEVVVPKPSKGDRFLGVHIYPGDIVEFSLTSGIPWKKKQGEPYNYDWSMKDPFYKGWD